MPQLNDLLAQTPRGIQKFAAIESPDRQQVEKDFGRLAFAFLRDRAPQLLDYLVGFEVVEQEPDGSKAVGIFGFNLNGSFWYVPAFFMNNQIKGMDLLYSMSQQSFYPLRESWINYILNKQTMELGGPADAGVRKDMERPNFEFLSSPPSGVKTACEQSRRIWNETQHDITEALEKDAEFQEALAGALAKVAGESIEIPQGRKSQLIRFLKEAGGPEAVYTILNTFEDEDFLKAACAFYDYRDLMVEHFSEALGPKEAQSKVKVVSRKEISDFSDIPKERKKRVIRDGFTIVDDRPKDELSELFNVDYMTNVGNPETSGRYKVIMRSGAQVPMYVLPQPFRSSEPTLAVAVDPDNGRFFTAKTNNIFAQFTADDTADQSSESDNIYDKAGQLGDMNIGDVYILVDEKLNSSLPFRIEAVVQEGDDTVRLKIKWLTRTPPGVDYDDLVSPVYDSNNAGFETYRDSYMFPVDRTGNLKKSRNNIVVPTKTFKAFKLQDSGDLNMSEYERADDPFVPADQSDIDQLMQKAGAHRLRVESMGGGEFTIMLDGNIDQSAVGYKTASVRLVRDYGLSPDDAEEVLKEADREYKSAKLVKFAQVMMPPPQMPQPGVDPTTGQMVTYPETQTVEGQTYGVPQPNQDMGPGGDFNLGSQEARQLGQLPTDVNIMAQQAANTGQQQVFDNGLIGGLAETYDVSAAIDSYIPEMLKALDRVGRILFLFYWKNEEFSERYGDQDITEMEDHLRAVFKSYGDLVLKLRQKTIEAEEAEFIQG